MLQHTTKKECELTAKEQLRWERQRRGWSRAYIADQIGVADPKTIGRWERGDAFPSAYFLQRLCALFALPAEALGLCPPESQAQPLITASLSRETGALSVEPVLELLPGHPCCDPALPPRFCGELVGRAQMLTRLKASLRATYAPAVVALSGLPGVGKSALAGSLAYDQDIQQQFCDGILWANLGPHADVLGELKRWASLLEIEDQYESVEEWMRAIHARIGSQAMLLVIDDAWTCQDALAFKIGGPNCAYIFTTRIPTVALYLAGAGVCAVDPLDMRHSLELLARFVPELVAHEAFEMRELVHLAGGLPLALQLIGSHLQAQVYSGQSRRWRAAIARLRQAEERLHLTMPRAPLEPHQGLPLDAPVSLHSEIELSYRYLDLDAQQALCALAHGLTDAASFTEEDALAIDGVSLDALDSLLDAGLLASLGQELYTLHKAIADFAACQSEQDCASYDLPARVSVLSQVREEKRRELEEVPGRALRQHSSISLMGDSCLQGGHTSGNSSSLALL